MNAKPCPICKAEFNSLCNTEIITIDGIQGYFSQMTPICNCDFSADFKIYDDETEMIKDWNQKVELTEAEH
jgi:hypothetical protein